MLYEPIFKSSRTVSSDYVFVSDFFADTLTGGAELTVQALIDSAPCHVDRITCDKVTPQFVFDNRDKTWIIGNFASLTIDSLRAIIKTVKYSVIEFDYKFCMQRCPAKHKSLSGLDCECHKSDVGQFVFHLFVNAQWIFWMSEAQRDIYHSRYPHLSTKTEQSVLSSVFDEKTLTLLQALFTERMSNVNRIEKKALVLRSDSWVKGTENAIKFCEGQPTPIQYEFLQGLSYEESLRKMSRHALLVYLPNGEDTCPRLVIEGKILGLDMVIDSSRVQHAREAWFSDRESTLKHLSQNATKFWRITSLIQKKTKPLISGYVTTFNCIEQEYPYIDTVKSLFSFCDEVVVLDGGSTDGTVEKLIVELSENGDFNNASTIVALSESTRTGVNVILKGSDKTLLVKTVKRDWASSKSALYDGQQKAEAKELCSGTFCWQMDVDEVVDQRDSVKIRDLCTKLLTTPGMQDLVTLPVAEFWGSKDKLRIDVNPWKWRLCRNLWHITHGVPKQFRVTDDSGELMTSLPGSDGCDFIDKRTHEVIEAMMFYDSNVDSIRNAALQGSADALFAYENWFKQVASTLPTVLHYSWVDISRKIRLYRDKWTRHWSVLYTGKYEDSAENNKFFDVPWSDVTDEMISVRAKELAENTGGWVFHEKWNGKMLPWLEAKTVLCNTLVNHEGQTTESVNTL